MTNNAMDKSKKDKRSNLHKKTVQKIKGIPVLCIMYSREKCEQKPENTLTS